MAEHDEEHGEEHGESHGSHGGGHGAGHGGAHEEHEGAPEWLISFADNVALMMGFFVILLAMNMGPKAKGPVNESDGAGNPTPDMVDFVIAMRAAFNNPFDMKSQAPGDQVFIKRIKEKQGESTDSGVPGQTEKVQSTRPTEYHSVTATIPFENDSALLTASARETITRTCEKLKGQRFVIEVRGHASPSEVRRSQEKGLDLSYARSKAVAKILVEQGLKWEQLRPSAAGDSDRRLARTYQRDEDNVNQRVEIIITHEPIAGDPYTKEVGRIGNEESESPPAKVQRSPE
jgi:outer membrane protein OmpA-like peptidoglycan-associated protein